MVTIVKLQEISIMLLLGVSANFVRNFCYFGPVVFALFNDRQSDKHTETIPFE